MRDQNRAEHGRWLRQAARDREAARSNAAAGFHEWACFLSHQTAEKALKAFLYLQGERPVLGHGIAGLVRRAARYDPRLEELGAAKRLDEVYIPSRYPNGLEDTVPGDFYTEEHSEQCIALAARVIASVRERSAS